MVSELLKLVFGNISKQIHTLLYVFLLPVGQCIKFTHRLTKHLLKFLISQVGLSDVETHLRRLPSQLDDGAQLSMIYLFS